MNDHSLGYVARNDVPLVGVEAVIIAIGTYAVVACTGLDDHSLGSIGKGRCAVIAGADVIAGEDVVIHAGP